MALNWVKPLPSKHNDARPNSAKIPDTTAEPDSDPDQLDSTASRKRRRTDAGKAEVVVSRTSLEDEENGSEDDESQDDDNEVDDDEQDDSEDEDSEDDDSESGSANDTDGEAPLAPKASTFASVEAPSRVKKALERLANKLDSKTPSAADASPLPGPSNPLIAASLDMDTPFSSLNVAPWLLQSLSNMAIYRPTHIQKLVIPQVLAGRDVAGLSRTGSGKTVAFAVPMLQRLFHNSSSIFGLVLTPTRELALQIFEQFRAISVPNNLRAVLVTGGADQQAQAIALSNLPHIVIATPGRLAELFRTAPEDITRAFRRVKVLVLDEADRLLDSKSSGSQFPDVSECIAGLSPPAQRQTLLFTATVTPEVQQLIDMPPKPGKERVVVCKADTQALALPPTLSQKFLKVHVTHREHFLHAFLQDRANADKTVILFCNHVTTAEFLHHLLRKLDYRVTSLHSGLSQRQRTDSLGRFRAAAARILVATDVASRGLDIPEVALVVNYDVPRDPDDYVHRVGRTARAGRAGEAVTFVGQRDVELLLAIEDRVGSKMEDWEEGQGEGEGINIVKKVAMEVLPLVRQKKQEALLEIEENREVGGKRKRIKGKMAK